jgi:hypothetical protein
MSEGIKRNVIKILEIPGKSVTEKYIANMRDKLDKQGLKYTINIVVDEKMFHSMQAESGQTGGDGSSFPYNLFEKFFNKVVPKENASEKNGITTEYDKLTNYNNERQGLIERLFSYTPLADVQPVTESERVTQPNEMSEQLSINESAKSEATERIEIPRNYRGVIKVEIWEK